MVLVGTNGVPVRIGVAVITLCWVSTVGVMAASKGKTVRAIAASDWKERFPIRANKEPIPTAATSIARTKEIRTANDKVGFSFQNYLLSVSEVIT